MKENPRQPAKVLQINKEATTVTVTLTKEPIKIQITQPDTLMPTDEVTLDNDDNSWYVANDKDESVILVRAQRLVIAKKDLSAFIRERVSNVRRLQALLE